MGKRCLVPAASFAASLILAGWLSAAEAPAEKGGPGGIVQKTRTEIAFSVAAGLPEAKERSFAIARVDKEGKEIAPPPNLKLEKKSGAFSWTPTESQAGSYEVAFLVKDEAGRETRVARSITVAAKDIVPPGDHSEIAKLLRTWYKEGTAAGNTGDFYDNRDRGHSQLDTNRFPQLDKSEYTEEQRQKRLDWALQLHLFFNHVTFGNSSTASGDPKWGSNPRHAQLSARAMEILYLQYTRNHVYMYPEHRDHDPGHNGRGGGYGDLFPANTPYVIISQGSSGSDQPFMNAVPYTLAAFRPEVKKLLTETGTLMPTLQMIFRSTNKGIEKPEDYLTGKAHPTVFEGGNVDALKMVKMAHEIERDKVPPMVLLAVQEEDFGKPGIDYFEGGERERLFDTPCSIARIVRSVRQVRRMVVTAKSSFDPNKRPLTYKWAVLRGDPDRIQIKPLDKEGATVEIKVACHERRPIWPGSPMESNRVDIGAFVHNGAYYSAPAFISLSYLDDEARTYALDGRILEMAYDVGDSTIGCAAEARNRARDPHYDITDWPALLALITQPPEGSPPPEGFTPSGGYPKGPDGQPKQETEKGGRGASDPSVPTQSVGTSKRLGGELLRKQFTADELADLQVAAKDLDGALAKEKEPKGKLDEAETAAKKVRDSVNEANKAIEAAKKANTEKPSDETKKALEGAQARLKAAQEEQKKADQAVNDPRRKFEEAQRPQHDLLTANRPKLGGSVKARVEKALNALKDDAGLYFDNQKAIRELLAATAPAREGQDKGGRGASEPPVRTQSVGTSKLDEGRKRASLAARDDLVKQGILRAEGDGFVLAPVLDGPEPPAKRLTKYERNRIEWFNIALLQNVFYPGLLNRAYQRNFSNPLIATPKKWRDVYRYAPDGRLLGWTRYEGAERKEFTRAGELVVKRDALNRPVETRIVGYIAETDREQPRNLKQVPGRIAFYAYDGDNDFVGRLLRSEDPPKPEPAKK